MKASLCTYPTRLSKSHSTRTRHVQPPYIRPSSQLCLVAHFYDLRINLANLVIVYDLLVVVAVLVGGGESVQRKSA